MNATVFDACVAAKWVLNEPGSRAAGRLRDYEELYAPSHWQAEASNAVWAAAQRGDLSADAARLRVAALRTVNVRETAIADLIDLAADIALRCHVTIYDALYVALAVERRLSLVTADRKLVARLRESRMYAGVATLLDEMT